MQADWRGAFYDNVCFCYTETFSEGQAERSPPISLSVKKGNGDGCGEGLMNCHMKGLAHRAGKGMLGGL